MSRIPNSLTEVPSRDPTMWLGTPSDPDVWSSPHDIDPDVWAPPVSVTDHK